MSYALNPPKVVAVLGPTNTGKTHYAVERMLARTSGVIGLPLRLLAREVYDKICAIKGANQCALITGEEKIVPEFARYYVCTVEAMPQDRKFAFVAVDEIQLMQNPERGHIFTDRLLNMRGIEETLFLGAETAREVIEALLPDARYDYRERFSTLSYGGETKLTRLPKRSVIVAFSAAEVYSLAELMRRHRGGAAVVMGALSPRTRNAQAELYQSGEVDFLIATDAVGMGLNLDTDHVAFASMRKFDGRRRRALRPMEAGQIAGRAGRFRNDGTFGTTGDCQPMDPELIARIENHQFDPMPYAEWRNSKLNFNSADALLDSLAQNSPHRKLRRIAPAVDENAFERLSAQSEISHELKSQHDVKRLWDICAVPDFRNLTIDAHVRLLGELYALLRTHNGKIPDDYMNRQIRRLDHIDGGVDVLSTRLAQIRTWTYCANKISWMFDAQHWIKRTRAVEDRLSDALHQSLISRFVDRRTSALLKGIGANAYMEATVKDNGEVWVDGHKIGALEGLSFKPDESESDLEAKALQATAVKAVAPEVDRRLTSLCGGTHDIFTLSGEGQILWGGKAIGRIAPSGTIFNPDADLIGGELGNPALQNLAKDRMRDFLRSEVSKHLEPLIKLREFSESESALPEAKGFAYTLVQENGSLKRSDHGKLLKDLSQDARKPLRELGVVFGQYDVFMRDLMKPKPAMLLGVLIAFGAGGHKKPFVPFAGVTSIPNTGEFESSQYAQDALSAAGYRACGPRIIRFDILNRLGMLIRQAQTQLSDQEKNPKGREFQVMQEMLAILGSTYEDARGVLTALGYQSKTRDIITPEGTIEKPAEAAPVDAPVQEAPATEATTTETAPEAAPTPAPAKPKRSGPKLLNVFLQRETNEAGETTDVPNTEVWFMPFRKNNAAPHRGGKPQKGFKGNPRKGGKGKPGGARKDQNPGRAKEPRRIEDSPFAALAALKDLKPKS